MAQARVGATWKASKGIGVFSNKNPAALAERQGRQGEKRREKEMEKITIKDVARLAGVSVATVSYIINGKHEERYTPETKRKVLQIVNLYNYRPSRLAQSFVSGKSRNLIILTGKQETILQKAESYDFIRLLGKTLEDGGYNLIIRTHLEDTRVDTADAIICVGIEEEKFRRLARENYVPLLSVDGKINDELFFQVYQDFRNVKEIGEREYGKDNYTIALVDMYNETLKEEIREIEEGIVFISDDDISKLPKGNVVTVNGTLAGIKGLRGTKMLLVPANTQARVDAVIECIEKARERVQGSKHTVRVK